MPEYSAGWLETKRGSNVICKHMHTLSLKTVRCEVVFTHLVCPTPRVVADMKRQVGILQVCQPLCTQFPTFFWLCRIRELKKKKLCGSHLRYDTFPCSLKQPKALHCGILILVRTIVRTRAGTTCVTDDLYGYSADYVTRHTFSGFFRERVRQNGGVLVAKIDAIFGLFLINLIHCSPL